MKQTKKCPYHWPTTGPARTTFARVQYALVSADVSRWDVLRKAERLLGEHISYQLIARAYRGLSCTGRKTAAIREATARLTGSTEHRLFGAADRARQRALTRR